MDGRSECALLETAPLPGMALGLKDSVFFIDYQGVRYIALDSEAALKYEAKARL